eukprot:6206579-Pleurochrysis_carterae.AAC.2
MMCRTFGSPSTLRRACFVPSLAEELGRSSAELPEGGPTRNSRHLTGQDQVIECRMQRAIMRLSSARKQSKGRGAGMAVE